MSRSFTLSEAWRAAKAAAGHHAANAIMHKHGGSGGDMNSVPANRVGACMQDLDLLSGGPDERDRPKPTTLDELAPQAWAKFNNPPSMKRGGE
jgi:hypothetical protein